MCRQMDPFNVLVIGREIAVDVDVPIIYLDSYGQNMAKRVSQSV